MWQLRTFCCIRKVSRTFLGRNAKIAVAKKGRGPKIVVRMLEIRDRKFWCLLGPMLTTSNKIGLFQSISRQSPILAQNDWTIISDADLNLETRFKRLNCLHRGKTTQY